MRQGRPDNLGAPSPRTAWPPRSARRISENGHPRCRRDRSACGQHRRGHQGFVDDARRRFCSDPLHVTGGCVCGRAAWSEDRPRVPLAIFANTGWAGRDLQSGSITVDRNQPRYGECLPRWPRRLRVARAGGIAARAPARQRHLHRAFQAGTGQGGQYTSGLRVW